MTRPGHGLLRCVFALLLVGCAAPTSAPVTATTAPAAATPVPMDTPVATDAPAATPTAVFPATRDPLTWPFSRDSIWNMPIGSEAVYAPANIRAAGAQWFDTDYLFVSPADAPWRDLYAPGNWGPGRCDSDVWLGSIPLGDEVIIPDATVNSTPNNAAAILLPDGRTLVQLEPMTRCEVGGDVYGYRASDVDLYGTGIPGGHYGSGLSSIGGTIRLGELLPTTGPIRHVLKLELNAAVYLYASPEIPGYRWPADKPDSVVWQLYGGTNPRLVMGTLLALPPDLTPEQLGLRTGPGVKIFHALQDYGGYIVDNTAWDAQAVAAEAGVEEEYFRETGSWLLNGDFTHDLKQIWEALHLIENNGPNAVGGGGPPRAPLAPDFASPPPPAPPALARDAWTATAFAGQGAELALDGDPASAWRSGIPIADGQTFTLDLGATTTFDMVMVASGPDGGETWAHYPHGYTLSISDDGSTWTRFLSIGGAAGPTLMTFPAQTGRYLQIAAGAFVVDRPWAIAEVELFWRDARPPTADRRPRSQRKLPVGQPRVTKRLQSVADGRLQTTLILARTCPRELGPRSAIRGRNCISVGGPPSAVGASEGTA